MRQFVLVLAAIVGAAPLAAQTDCTVGHLPYNSNEAKLLRKFEVPLTFGSAGAAPDLARGEVQLGGDLSYLPHIDPDLATPTYCRPGKPPENVNLLFGIPRPRVMVGLGSGWSIEGSWVPPIRVNGAKADLFGFALAERWATGPVTHLTARVHGTVGTIHADITCTADQVKPSGPPQCAGGLPGPSDDRLTPDVFGAELAMDWAPAGWMWHPYAGIGYNAELARFVTDPNNILVHQDIGGNYYRPALFGGGTVAVDPAFGLTFDLYVVPGDATTWRVGGRYALGKR